MHCDVLFSHIKNCFKNNSGCFEFKSKDKYERKMLNILKRNLKQNKSCLKM